MIIQCTSCEKKFNVPDAAITSAGRLVQCSSCGNKWTQYPIKAKSIVSKKIPKPSIPISPKNKKTKKRTSPVPYSKEYMEQKWGTSVQSYAKEKGLHVINTPAASSSSVAELVFAHLYGGVRYLYDSNRAMPLEGDTNFKALKKSYAKGRELRGKTIGIIGT